MRERDDCYGGTESEKPRPITTSSRTHLCNGDECCRDKSGKQADSVRRDVKAKRDQRKKERSKKK